MKVLIVYFSNKGSTRILAEKVLAELGFGDILELKYEKPVRAFAPVRYGYQAVFSRNVKLAGIKTAMPPNRYDLVIIATPTWAGRCCAPIRAFLLQHGKTLLRTASIVTHSGPGPEENVLSQIDTLTGQRRIAALDVSKTTTNTDELVRVFVSALNVTHST